MIEGFCAPQFQEVKDQFEQNFRERGEVGASLCLSYKGDNHWLMPPTAPSPIDKRPIVAFGIADRMR